MTSVQRRHVQPSQRRRRRGGRSTILPGPPPSLRTARPCLALAPLQRHLALRPAAAIDAIRLLPGGGHAGDYGTHCAGAGMRSEWTSGARRSSPGSSRATGASSAGTSAPTPQDSQEHVLAELEAAVAELLDDSVGGGRLRRAVSDRPGARRRRPLRQPAARERAAPRPHARAVRPPGRARQRRERGRDRRVAGRRRARRGRPRDAHARDGRRRRRHLRRQAVPRPQRRRRRARPRRDRPRRPAVPGRVHRARPSRGVRERQRGDRCGARGVRPVGRRAPARAARERGRREGEGAPRGDRRATSAPASAPSSTSSRPSSSSSAAASASRPSTTCAGRPRRSRGRRRSSRCASDVRLGEGRARHRRRPDRRRLRRASRRSTPPDAARRLRDADREPRGRDAARPRRARGRRRRALRGHAPHARACSSGTGSRRRLLSYHEHNEAKRTAELLPRLEAGERVALVSDAGLPGVSDPGARLVRAALDAGVDVTVLPGPSAVETALVASGLVAEQYRFLGFLPRGEKKLAELWDELRGWPWPAVAFESPQRLPATLALARGGRSGARGGCVPRAHEAVRGGRARDGRRARGAVRRAAEGRDHARPGAGAARDEGGEERALAAVAELVAAGVPRRQAAEIVSRLAGIPRNRLYKQLAVSRFDNGGRPRYSAPSVAHSDNDTAAGGSSLRLPGLGAGRVRLEPAGAGAGPAAVRLRRGAPVRVGPAPWRRHRRRLCGETVVAPAAGTVSFAGTVPTNGKSVTIETADGYSVTLTHLGSIGVVKGAAVAEQDAIGTVGPSGTPEVDGPYVHLGIRVTADPNGYVDPLGLLPPDPESSATESDSSVSQPSSSSAAAREQTGACGAEEAAGGDLARLASCCTEPRPDPPTGARARAALESSDEPVVAPACRARSRAASRRAPLGGRSSSRWRPGRSVSTPATSCGHPCPSCSPAASRRARLPELVCNGAAAVFALALVLAASRRRRRSSASSTTGAEVLQLPRPAAAHAARITRRVSRSVPVV